MKRIMQFRYYGKFQPKSNYPALSHQDYTDLLVVGNIFKDYGPVSHLGIQGPSGLKFYLNNSYHPISIGETGIYELNLENIGRINSIRFDKDSLYGFYDSGNQVDRLIIDIVYEGGN